MTALLLEAAWKSGLVAALALAAAALIRARPAAERVTVLRLGVVMVLALPCLVAVMPAVRVETPVPAPAPVETAVRRTEPVAPPVATAPVSGALPVQAPVRAEPAWRPSPASLVLALYLAGVLALAARLLAGVAVLARWSRRARPVEHDGWLAALDRAAGGRRRPRLLASRQVASPLSWGWPAVILVNADALPRADRAEAVLAHEMGHVRRGDWPFLMLSRLMTALFWFNPLVWLLQRELSRQSEEAADAWAVRSVGRLDYAGALVAMARSGPGQAAALGMAAPSSELARRVAAVLKASAGKGRPWPTGAAAAACIALATPLSALELRAETLAAAPGTARPVSLRDKASPVPMAAQATASLVRAAFRPEPAPASAPMDPERRAAALRQRDQGAAMMHGAASAMQGEADRMRHLAAFSPAEGRAELLAAAEEMERQSGQLRAEAEALAARDPATLQPMTPEEEQAFAREMQAMAAEIQASLEEVGAAVIVDVGAAVNAALNLGPAPPPSPPSPPSPMAEVRESADRMRREADQLDLEAASLERERPPPELADDFASRLAEIRGHAADLRREAADLDREATDREREAANAAREAASG